MLLFAYASNMNVEEFAKKVPSAKRVAIARLPGYIFTFGLTADDQSTKANIIASPAANAEVWGVLIAYNDNDRDKFYYPDGDLELKQVNVFDEQDNMHRAEAFMTKPHAINEFLLPYNWYVAKVVKLARAAGLPAAYINAIELMDSKTDPNPRRRAKHGGKP